MNDINHVTCFCIDYTVNGFYKDCLIERENSNTIKEDAREYKFVYLCITHPLLPPVIHGNIYHPHINLFHQNVGIGGVKAI